MEIHFPIDFAWVYLLAKHLPYKYIPARPRLQFPGKTLTAATRNKLVYLTQSQRESYQCESAVLDLYDITRWVIWCMIA